jgi:3-keto-5-aminohexanoate cleavage enzyme
MPSPTPLVVQCAITGSTDPDPQRRPNVPLTTEATQAFLDHGVRPEIECLDSGHVGLALQLRDEGLLEDPLVVQFVLGVPGSGVPATVEMVEHLRRMLPAATPWSVCAIGQAQLPLNAYCILAGGHVRTGLEDNLFYRRGERATNAELVARVVRLAHELERPVATPDEARAILSGPTATRERAAMKPRACNTSR